MLKLTDKEWREYNLKSLGFTIHHGKRLTKENRKEGLTPLLTAGEKNEGVSSFISNNREKYNKSISVDMFGNAFTHEYECSGDDNIYFFIDFSRNKYHRFFVTSCIKTAINNKYSYGKQFRQFDADNLKIMLPVTSTGEPDWQFMEDYTKEREKIILSKYKQYKFS